MSREFHRRSSIALNVLLAMAAVMLARYKPERTPTKIVKVPNETAAAMLAFTYQSPRYPETASASDKRRWLVDELRVMGIPNEILARVVLADLDKGWTKRASEVTMERHGDPDALAALQLETDKSKDAEMRAALGEEGFRQWDQGNMLRQVSQGKIQLTAAETDQAYDVWKKLQQRQLDLEQAQVEGTMDPADINNATAKAASEFSQQMKAVLGDERYAKSQQTDEDTATAQLRQNLAKANPGDSQFQELLKTQQQWNDQRSALDKQFQNDPSSAAYTDQIKALDAARDQEYRRVLGDDVFNGLQKEQDPGYTQMKKYETLWSLDDTSIDSVYGMMKYYQKSVEDYQAQARALEAGGQSVDWDGVNKNLEVFAEQTQQTLQNYVGQDRFNKMAQNGVFQLSPPVLTGHSKPAP
ncbi:MAG TPA: hypothetical protein VKV04_24325 [Verrucomicrobiae bacterium]|nr:hypothetical protein [Verrucomicrobiae bacterium]